MVSSPATSAMVAAAREAHGDVAKLGYRQPIIEEEKAKPTG